MGFEVVKRNIDSFTAFQGSEMLDEEFTFEAGGVVKIDVFAILKGKIGKIAIVPVK